MYLADARGGTGDKDDFAGNIFVENGAKDATEELEDHPWWQKQ